MTVLLVPLDEGSPLLGEVSDINESSFPECERVSVGEMLRAGSLEGSGFEAIVSEGRTAGFMLYLVQGDVCFLGFLAVKEDLRSAGIGGKALEILKGRMSGKRVFLNAESPGQVEDDRDRRIRFYSLHGLVPCGLRTEFSG